MTIVYSAIAKMTNPEVYWLFVTFKIDALFLFVGLLLHKDKAIKVSFTKGAVGVWGIWSIYTFINWTLIGINPDGILLINKFWGLMRIYCFFAVLYYEASIDFDGALNRLFYIFFIYAILGIFFQESELITKGHNEGRNRTTLGNHFPLAMCSYAFIAFLAKTKKIFSNLKVFSIICMVIAVIIESATRKCLGAVFLLAIFYFLSQFNMKSPKTYILLLVSLIGLYTAYCYVLDNTLIGDRLKNVEDEVNVSVNVPWYLSFLGDRASHYMLAWDMFLDNPINGVGTKNFMHLSRLGMPPHTEYMTQLCEGGLIGSSLFIIFLVKIIRLLKKSFEYHIDKGCSIICLSGVFMLLFISLTAWIYEGAHFFVIWSLVLAYCSPIFSNYKVN